MSRCGDAPETWPEGAESSHFTSAPGGAGGPHANIGTDEAEATSGADEDEATNGTDEAEAPSPEGDTGSRLTAGAATSLPTDTGGRLKSHDTFFVQDGADLDESFRIVGLMV